MSGEDESKSTKETMEARAHGGELLEYRLKQVELMLQKVSDSVHELRDMLTPVPLLAARVQVNEEATGRAFGLIRELDLRMDIEHKALNERCAANDGKFEKWFNRGMGFAGAVSLLFGLFGSYITRKVESQEATLALVPSLVSNTAQQKRTTDSILRRLGIDPDLVRTEP